MKRRYLFQALATMIGVMALSRLRAHSSKLEGGSWATNFKDTEKNARSEEAFEVVKTEAEWREILTPEQYNVLRQHGTEWAGSSPLNQEFRAGLFHCAGCDLPLFSSETKFDSQTGWPSFYAPLEGAIATTEDNRLNMVRTEVHCHRCGGHLGHVFADGPPPTGQRFCINGVALNFVPD